MSNKLAKVNVPELFYQRFLADRPQTTPLLQKLASTTPTRRGQGYTRWLKNITEADWNELYQYAAEGRAHMQGADRETTLRPAICARVLADRMEVLGVDNPVTYTPKQRAKKTTTTATPAPAPTVADDDGDDTDLSSSLPQTPPTVDQHADVDEASDDDLDFFGGELANS